MQLHFTNCEQKLIPACSVFKRCSGLNTKGSLKELFSCVTFTSLVFEMMYSAKRAYFAVFVWPQTYIFHKPEAPRTEIVHRKCKKKTSCTTTGLNVAIFNRARERWGCRTMRHVTDVELLVNSQWRSMVGECVRLCVFCGYSWPAFGDVLPGLSCSHLQFLLVSAALRLQPGLQHTKRMLAWAEAKLTLACLALKASLVALSVHLRLIVFLYCAALATCPAHCWALLTYSQW